MEKIKLVELSVVAAIIAFSLIPLSPIPAHGVACLSGSFFVTISFPPNGGSTNDNTVSSNGDVCNGIGAASVGLTGTIDGGGDFFFFYAGGTGPWISGPTAPLSGGSHTITVIARAFNPLGNLLAINSASSTFIVDTVAPTASVSSPANNAIVNTATVSVSGTASDATSGIQKVEVSVDGGTFNLATGTTSWSFTTINLSEVAHTITAKATDNAGNTQTSSVSITVDTIANASHMIIASANSGTIRFFPELGALQNAPVGSDIQSTYSKTTSTNREFRRGFIEFTIPVFQGQIQQALLILTEPGGSILSPVPPDLHGLSHYQADLLITTDDYDRPTTSLSSFETDANDSSRIFGFDITSLINQLSTTDRNLGFRIKLAVDPTFNSIGSLGTGFSGPFATSTFPRIEITDTIAPSISISSPANNAILNTATVPVSGTASDSGSGVQKVEINIDDNAFYKSQFGSLGSGNGQFNAPQGIALDSSGNIYVVELNNHRVQKFNSAGVYQSQFGSLGSGNGQFNNPHDIVFDSSGNIYVADGNNVRIEKFNSAGGYLSQFGSFGSGNGQFNNPLGIAFDSSGNIYVADTGNHRVQKFNSAGVYQSQFGSLGSGNGQFNQPQGIGLDSSGNIYVVDSNNGRVQKFNSAGVYQSQFGSLGSGNGQFSQPHDIVFDSSGNIYVADQSNHRVQKFNSAGVYQSQFGSLGSGNGQLSNPVSIALDSSGNIFVSEQTNNRVSEFGTYSLATGTTSWSFTTPSLSDGAHTITARSTDNAGLTQTTSITITVDTIPPAAPVISTASATTSDSTPTISGTTDTGSTVQLFDGVTSLGSATVTGTGWTFTSSVLADGLHSITAKASDAVGNTSTDSNVITLTVDTTSPAITLLGTNPVTIAQGSVYTDAGATAFDTRDGVLTSSIVTVNPVNTAVLGSYTITYNVADSAGNAATQVTRTVKVVTVQLDADQYFINHAGLITVNDPAANTDGTTKQTVSATIASTSDPGFAVTLTETTNTSGTFQNTNYIVFTNGITDPITYHLHVTAGDTVTANYNPSDTALIISDAALPPVVGDPGNYSERETCTDWSGDGDGDGICNDWENIGAPTGLSTQLFVDTNGDAIDDAIIQYDLTCDAANLNDDPNCPSPLSKDIYLEIDWMTGHRPSDAAINLVKTAFSNRGITLHVQISDEVGHQNTITWSDATGASEFDQIKDNFFGTLSERTTGTAQEVKDRLTAKRQVFHYVLFAHDITNNVGTSAVAETPGNDILITLGSFTGGTGTVDQQAGTLMHELGHNLNLLHGGPFPDIANIADEPNRRDNCKPNYLSVMSYSRQLAEFVVNRELTYSRMALANLDENSLDENVGVQLYTPNPAELTAYGPASASIQTTTTGVSVNWNRLGSATDTGVQANINDFDITGCNTDEYVGVPERKTLTGYEDWGNLKYYFRDTNTFDDGVHTVIEAIPELTIDIVTEFRLSFLDTLDQAIQNLPDTAFVGDPISAKTQLHTDVLSADNLITQQDLDGAIAILQQMKTRMDGSVGGDSSDDLIVSSSQAPILEILDNILAGYTIASEPAGIHIISPQEVISDTVDEIQELVDSGVLNAGQGNSLITKLNGAIAKLDVGNNIPACNQLDAFVNEVNALVNSNKLSSSQAQTLIDSINDVQGEVCL